MYLTIYICEQYNFHTSFSKVTDMKVNGMNFVLSKTTKPKAIKSGPQQLMSLFDGACHIVHIQLLNKREGHRTYQCPVVLCFWLIISPSLGPLELQAVVLQEIKRGLLRGVQMQYMETKQERPHSRKPNKEKQPPQASLLLPHYFVLMES